jgi:hypothetical protein
MVKIQTRKIPKKYKRKVRIYKQHLMLFPLARNEELAPFLKEKMQFGMNIIDDTLNITLRKNGDTGKIV